MAKHKKMNTADIKESAHNVLLAGLGALSVAEEEGRKFFKNLVKRGEEVQEKNQDRFESLRGEFSSKVETAKSKAGDAWEKVSENLDDRVTATLHKMGVPTKDEISTLTKRVEELTKAVERLKPRVTPTRTAGPRATAKAKADATKAGAAE